MPYALFSNDAKLSKAYPTAADVWKIAQKSGLVVDVVSEDDKAGPASRCWTMTTRSSRASSSRMKTPPETRPRPSAKRRRNCSWRRRTKS